MTNEDILSLNSGKKFDIVLMNPPYGSTTNLNLDSDFLELVNEISNKSITIMPEKINAVGTSMLRVIKSKHIKEVDVIPAKEAFNEINVPWKFVGIYVCDNKNEYDTIKINTNDYSEEIGIDKESRIRFCTKLYTSDKLVNIIDNKQSLYDKLISKYSRIICDHDDVYIYEENWANGRPAKEGGKPKPKQQSLSRVKEYLKSGKYKYCLYKGSFNHEYDEVQEWDGQDPDKLFKGQICWLMNSKRVKNNMKYWMECPLFDLWRKYFLANIKAAARGSYWALPALDFEQPESDFRKYVDSLNDFTADEIEELKKFKVHNADKLTND